MLLLVISAALSAIVRQPVEAAAVEVVPVDWPLLLAEVAFLLACSFDFFEVSISNSSHILGCPAAMAFFAECRAGI